MLFPRKAKNEIYKKSSVRQLNANGGYSYLLDDGYSHLLIHSEDNTPSYIACSRSLCSVPLGNALVHSLFITRSPHCRECLSHFYASQFSKDRDSKLSKVINHQTRQFNDRQLASALITKVILKMVSRSKP